MDLLHAVTSRGSKEALQSEVAVRKAEEGKDVKIIKLTQADDIEAYLTTF